MRAAERREEVVESVFVRDVDRSELQADFVLFRVEQVVVADGDIEQAPRLNPLRILVVVLPAWRWYLHQAGRELICWANVHPRRVERSDLLRRRRPHPNAAEARLELLIGGQRRAVEVVK